jgi:hypothetical protein
MIVDRQPRRLSVVVVARALREQRRRNRFGDNAACECCGASTLVHLAKVEGYVVCACCLALARGREILELHHLPGHGKGPTVRVCASCHAELSELQRDWLAEPDLEIRLARGYADVEAVRARWRR